MLQTRQHQASVHVRLHDKMGTLKIIVSVLALKTRTDGCYGDRLTDMLEWLKVCLLCVCLFPVHPGVSRQAAQPERDLQLVHHQILLLQKQHGHLEGLQRSARTRRLSL